MKEPVDEVVSAPAIAADHRPPVVVASMAIGPHAATTVPALPVGSRLPKGS